MFVHRGVRGLEAAIRLGHCWRRADALERKEKRARLEKLTSSNRSQDVFNILVGIKVISELSPI
jgi:hypothetical protein